MPFKRYIRYVYISVADREEHVDFLSVRYILIYAGRIITCIFVYIYAMYVSWPLSRRSVSFVVYIFPVVSGNTVYCFIRTHEVYDWFFARITCTRIRRYHIIYLCTSLRGVFSASNWFESYNNLVSIIFFIT